MNNFTTKKKYTLFIDESGKSKLSDQGDRFLLSGVIIENDLHQALSNLMLSLKNKNNIPTNTNIHAYDLFEKEEVLGAKLKNKEIIYFFEHLIHLIRGAEMKCILYEADKKPFRDRIERKSQKTQKTEKAIHKYLKSQGDHDILYEVLTAKMILEFGKFLEKEQAHGEIIAILDSDDEEIENGRIVFL
jgi:ERCC4-related helicase